MKSMYWLNMKFFTRKRYRLSTSASSSSWPELEAVTSPLPDLDSTSKIGVRITRWVASRARSPVDWVDLPETNVEWSVGIVIHGISITTRLMRNDTLTASLIPARVFSTPSSRILHAGRGTAWTAWAFASGTVDSTSSCKAAHSAESNKDNDNERFHIGNLIFFIL
jgi:hypothetical protein